MRRIDVKPLGLTITAFAAMFFLTGFTNAQCVQCEPSKIVRNSLSCQSSSSGGTECNPSSDGQSCLIAGVCSNGGGEEADLARAEGQNKLTRPTATCSKDKIGRVELDKNIIREIGEKHERLAIALAWLNRSGFLGTKDVKIYLSPLEIDDEVYSQWMKSISEDSQEIALSAAGRISTGSSQLPDPPKGAQPIVYSVDVITPENSTHKIIRFSSIKGAASDPTFTSLDLFVEELHSSDPAANTEKKWKIMNWELK